MRDLDQEEQKRKDKEEALEDFVCFELEGFLAETAGKAGISCQQVEDIIKKVIR